MKNYHLLIVLLIFRISDLTSTFFAGKGDLKIETSPLVSKLNFNWMGLILFNLVVVLLFFLIKGKYNNKYLTIKENKFRENIISFSSYLSYTYFGKKLSIKELLFKTKGFDYKIFIPILINTMIKTIIVLSFFATVNNLLITFKQKGLLYGFSSKTLILFYSSIVIAFLLFINYSVIRYIKLLK